MGLSSLNSNEQLKNTNRPQGEMFGSLHPNDESTYLMDPSGVEIVNCDSKIVDNLPNSHEIPEMDQCSNISMTNTHWNLQDQVRAPFFLNHAAVFFDNCYLQIANIGLPFHRNI